MTGRSVPAPLAGLSPGSLRAVAGEAVAQRATRPPKAVRADLCVPCTGLPPVAYPRLWFLPWLLRLSGNPLLCGGSTTLRRVAAPYR